MQASLIYTRLHARAREYAPNTFLVASIATVGLAGALAHGRVISGDVVSWLALGWVAPTSALMLMARSHAVQVQKKFGGRILAFAYVPTPIGSLLKSLSTQDVATAELKQINLMSSDLSESVDYYEKGDEEGVSLTRILDNNPDLAVIAIGPSKKRGIKAPHGRISLVVAQGGYEETEHVNLISTKGGQNYVWYEPYHNVINRKHYFTKGAYLVETDETGKARVEMLYDKLRTGLAPHARIDAEVLSITGGATESALVGASVASQNGGPMRTKRKDKADADLGFGVFRLGLVIMIAGLVSWLALLASNQVAFALGASVIGAIGANMLMLGILGGRRGERAGHTQQS